MQTFSLMATQRKTQIGMRQNVSLIQLSAIVALVMIWQLVAILLESTLFPPPTAIAAQLWAELVSGELPQHMGYTLGRVAAGFGLSMLAGSLVGMLMGTKARLDSLFNPLLILLLNIPALVVIFLCFIWFGLNEFAAVLAVVINKTPNVAVTIREGARSIDRGLLDVAKAYRLPAWKTFKSVYFPQLHPYLLAASRSGLPLVWKIILVVELIGCSNGIGFKLGVYFQYFDITSILAYTLAFALLVALIESLIVRPWEKSVMRWRSC